MQQTQLYNLAPVEVLYEKRNYVTDLEQMWPQTACYVLNFFLSANCDI